MSSTMRVRVLSSIKVDGRILKGGEPVLPADVARAYLATGSVVAVDTASAAGEGDDPPKPAATADDIAKAVGALDRSSEKHFTKSGKPRVAAVEELLELAGFDVADVSAEDVGAAWQSITAAE